MLGRKPMPLGLGLRTGGKPAPGARLALGGMPKLPGRGRLVTLKEAVATELVETKEKDQAKLSAANGTPSLNGVHHAPASLNGNGNGVPKAVSSNGNGVAPPTVLAAAAAVAVAQSAGAAAVASTSDKPQGKAANAPSPSSSNGNGNGSATNGDGRINAMETLDWQSSPEVGGQIGTVAATSDPAALAAAAKAAAERRLQRSAAGTPYQAPGGRWSKFKSYSTFQRTMEIWVFAVQFAFRYFLLNQKWTYGKEGMTKEAVSARKTELGIWLREGLVKLGPTFIKVGQQFSTRVDVLSPEFIKELEKLQDNVPPFDQQTALEILQYNLGRPVNEVFEEFNPVPIAAASLGQVHLAKLNGQQVVVKVQRPGLKELFDIDLKNIRGLAVWLQKVDPKTDGAARDWVAIYDECSRILYQEIDYTLEGRNADQFRENFDNVPWVKVPKVFWEVSSPEVLVLEYVPGVKVNDAAALDRMGLDRKRLARLTVESYLQQILRHGFFHADPHPGNVAVDATDGGRLIYYDFGMMGSIAPSVKTGLLELFYGVYQKDPDRCLDALVQMGVYVPVGDKTAVRRTAEFFLASFQERLDTQKKEREVKGEAYSASFKPQRSKDEAKERRKQILSSIGEDLLVASADQPFRFPATFTFVVRSFTVLDGIGKSLDARFDLSEIAAPYARELLLETSPATSRLSKALLRGLDRQNRAVTNLFKGPNKIEDIAATMTKLERGDLKLRVRALEAERALARVQAWQRVIFAALAASTLVNVGTVLSVSALSAGATASFMGAGACAMLLLKNFLRVVQLERRELQLSGAV